MLAAKVQPILQETNKRKAVWGSLLLLAASLACPPVCVPQEGTARNNKGDLLPATIGEPLTIAPSDRSDVSCSIVEWNAELPKPALTLLCPPEGVFAPLHVYLKFSWLKPEDVPAYARAIRAPAKTSTKLRTDRMAVWIWLGVQEKQDAPPHGKWIAFTGVVDMALLSLPGKR